MRRFVPILLALALQACQAPAAPAPDAPATTPGGPAPTGVGTTGAAQPPAPAAPPTLTGSRITGVVSLPANWAQNLVAAGGGNLVAAGGGNLVAAGSGNYALTQAAGFALQAAGDVTVKAATVVLVDAKDNPVPGVAPTQTDDQGGYAFENVPADKTYRIKVQLRIAGEDGPRVVTLSTFVTTDAEVKEEDISLATTLAAELVAKDLEVDGDGGRIDEAAFVKLVEGLITMLQARPPEDEPDLEALATEADGYLDGAAELKEALEEVRTGLAQDTATDEDEEDEQEDAGSPGSGNPKPKPFKGKLVVLTTAYTGVATPLAAAVYTEEGDTPATLTIRVSSVAEPAGEDLALTREADGVLRGTIAFERPYDEGGLARAIAANGAIAVYAEGGVDGDALTIAYGTQSAAVTYEEPDSTLTGKISVGHTARQAAQVQLVGPSFSRKTATRADGSYAFHDVPVGSYTLTISVNGAVTRTVPVDVPAILP